MFVAVISTDSSGNVGSWNIAGFNSTGLRIDSCYIPYQCSYDSTEQNSPSGNTFLYTGRNTTPGSWSTHGAPPTSGRVGVLSHIAAGGGWTTVMTLVNNSSSAPPLTIAFHTETGTPLTLPLTVTSQGVSQTNTTNTTSSINATINPKATLQISTGDGMSSTVVGWADVFSLGTLGGFAIFRQTPQNGSPSEGTVPLQTTYPNTITLPYDNAGFVTGVALANLSTSAMVTATVWDEAGNQLITQNLAIIGNGHMSFVLPNQLLLTAGKRGIVQFQNSGGLAGLGLRFSPFGTFTSVPTLY